MKITFETAKELNKYLPIETEKVIFENEKINIKKQIPQEVLDSMVHYPAPLLSELLVNTPIWVSISIHNKDKQVLIMGGFGEDNYQNRCIQITDNLTEQVAQVILQYYKQINGENDDMESKS